MFKVPIDILKEAQRLLDHFSKIYYHTEEYEKGGQTFIRTTKTKEQKDAQKLADKINHEYIDIRQ